MNKLSKAQLLATSAIIGLSVLNLAPAAQAQAAFGVHNDQPGLLEVTIEDEGASEIAKRSRGTPRIANRLLRRVRDYAEVKGNGRIDLATADRALKMLDVDPQGFDVMDRKLLEAVIHRFDGGPVGLDNIAASIGEEAGTIEDVIEPYLIQQGYLQRTQRGRMATALAYGHLGLASPRREGDLFP